MFIDASGPTAHCFQTEVHYEFIDKNVTSSNVFNVFTGHKRIRGLDLRTYGRTRIRHPHTFGGSLDASTPFSAHWIWASLSVPSRGHHTHPGKAEPPDYFSSSSTVRVQQQPFVQFLTLCSLPEDTQCNVPSQKAEDINAKLVPLSAYNHRCYIVFCTLYTICPLPPFKEQCFWILWDAHLT